MATAVVIPYSPRHLQMAIHNGMGQHRFGVAVCHRRFGKTVCAVNHLQRCATSLQRARPRFAYIAPTYRQGKATAWDYMKFYARPIPGININESELRIDYPNGGQVRIYGADNPDSLRGIYLDGAVLDEYGLMPPNVFGEVIRPLLADREGWALFLGTPNGKNQFYEAIYGDKDSGWEGAKSDPSWFYAEFKASQTGLLSQNELTAARSVMTQDQYEQEFECSFEASVKGAVFAKELQQSRERNRVTRVPYDPNIPVETDWDLGIDDSTAIWFSQSLYTGEVHLIDYYENSGQGLQHYRQVLNQKSDQLGYAYGTHWAPHDIKARELGTGRTRQETAADLGIYFQVAPRLLESQAGEVTEGIHAARMLFPKCWFDAERCKDGIEALQHYHFDYNSRINEFTPRPVHDWASHGADAFRGLSVRHTTPRAKNPSPPKQYDHDPADAYLQRRRGVASGLTRGGY